MSIEQEIRNQIENIKKLKMAVGEINNHLSALEGMCREDKQKWIDDAYEDGYKDGKASIDKGCEGCKWESKRGYDEPCKHCCKAYLNQYAPMPKQEDSIKVGDEVIHKENATWTGVVVQRWFDDDDDTDKIRVMGKTGCSSIYHTESFKRTGCHFDISSILEKLRNG